MFWWLLIIFKLWIHSKNIYIAFIVIVYWRTASSSQEIIYGSRKTTDIHENIKVCSHENKLLFVAFKEYFLKLTSVCRLSIILLEIIYWNNWVTLLDSLIEIESTSHWIKKNH